MARLSAPPPKLTKELTKRIREKTKSIRSIGDAPSSPLDWIAALAGVRRQTIKKWCKRAYTIRGQRWTGGIADQWIRFIDAVDDLTAVSADSTVKSIEAFARNAEHNKAFDAWIYLDKRALKIDEELAACDVDPEEGESSVAHMPQDQLDALTDAERDQMDKDLITLLEISQRMDALHAATLDRVNEPSVAGA